DSVHRRRAVFSRDGGICPNAVCSTANARTVFVAAVKRAVESAAKRESSRSNIGSFASLAEVRCGAPGGKESGQAYAGDASAPPEKIARQRGAASLLYKRRSLQLRVASTACGPNHSCLPGMDDGHQRHGRVANRRGFALAETCSKQRNCADAVADKPRRRYLATCSGR